MKKRGFTLIELSLVLVIIGLLVGGVLGGVTLMETAKARSLVGQLEAYNIAVKAFQNKYDCLPGDCAKAANYGFLARNSSNGGLGDGNGIIEGRWAGGVLNTQQGGEPTVFWRDLSAARLISENFSTVEYNQLTNSGAMYAPEYFHLYWPRATTAKNHYIAVWSGGITRTDGKNYFTVIDIGSLGNWGACCIFTSISGGPKVSQTFYIDSKLDDGLPQSGKMMALVPLGSDLLWAGGASSYNPTTYTSSTAASSTSCFDNASSAGQPQRYSVAYNGGSGQNCPFSIEFQ